MLAPAKIGGKSIREELMNNYPNGNNLIKKRDKYVKKHQKRPKHLDLSNNRINFKINNSYGIKLDVFRCFFIILMVFYSFLSFLG